eukprot:3883083-Amphidinium_carterae.2
MELDEAKGRYIACQGVYSIPELTEHLKGNANVEASKLACQKGIVPKGVLYMVGWAIGLKWSQISTLGLRYNFDGSKVTKDLGIEYRTPATMANDMVNDMAARQFIKAPA